MRMCRWGQNSNGTWQARKEYYVKAYFNPFSGYYLSMYPGLGPDDLFLQNDDQWGIGINPNTKIFNTANDAITFARSKNWFPLFVVYIYANVEAVYHFENNEAAFFENEEGPIPGLFYLRPEVLTRKILNLELQYDEQSSVFSKGL